MNPEMGSLIRRFLGKINAKEMLGWRSSSKSDIIRRFVGSKSRPAATHFLQRKGSYMNLILMRADPSAESNLNQAKIIEWTREISPHF